MRPHEIFLFVFRDLCNRRVRLDMVAGVVTLAIATMISALSISFSRSAIGLIDVMMEPVRGVASTVRVKPTKGASIRRFGTEEYNLLIRRIEELEKHPKLIEARSALITDIPNGTWKSFQLLNSSQHTQNMDGVRVWSAPHNSPFLQETHGMNYVYGRAFSEPGLNPDCLEGVERSPPAASQPVSMSRTDGGGLRARLGVIVNSRYLTKFTAHNEHDLDVVIQEESNLPRHIWLRVKLDGDYVNIKDNKPNIDLPLCVTGVVHAPDYDFDLVFTEDLARAYFLVSKGAFYGRYSERFDQWESWEPLTRLDTEGRKPDLWPENEEDFDYVSLSASGLKAHNLLILAVTDWRIGDNRKDLRTHLLQPVEHEPALYGEEAVRLADWARTVADPPKNEKGEAMHGRVREVRDLLSEMLNTELHPYGGFELTGMFQVQERGGSDGMGKTSDAKIRTWIVEDSNSKAEIAWSPQEVKAWISFAPKWWVEVPMETYVDSILRLEGLIKSYDKVMFWVVIVFAATAAGLLSFSHVLRKGRDIGVLTANGAGSSAIFSIYITQISAMAILGWLTGLAFAWTLAPALEGEAALVLQRYIESEESRKTIEKLNLQKIIKRKYDSILELDMVVFSKAFLWVVPAALAGALFPVFQAARADPLSNMSKGI